MLVPRLLPNNDREPLTRADCARARGVRTARGGVWTAVQVGSILQRVGHFASGRSTKQQTNNKQQAKLTPSRQRPKGGQPPTHAFR